MKNNGTRRFFTEMLLCWHLCKVISEVTFISRLVIDTRGSGIDDNTGTTLSSFKPEVNASFLQRRGGTPPLSFLSCATRTRSNLVVTLVNLGSERLSFVSGHNLAFCRLFLPFRSFPIPPLSRCQIALPRKRFSVHLRPVFRVFSTPTRKDMYPASRHFGASYIGRCPRWACPSIN